MDQCLNWNLFPHKWEDGMRGGLLEKQKEVKKKKEVMRKAEGERGRRKQRKEPLPSVVPFWDFAFHWWLPFLYLNRSSQIQIFFSGLASDLPSFRGFSLWFYQGHFKNSSGNSEGWCIQSLLVAHNGSPGASRKFTHDVDSNNVHFAAVAASQQPTFNGILF